MPKSRGLGMGLDALFEDNAGDSHEAQTIRITAIEPNKNQPRKNISEETISTLADSIAKHGLIQPIIVRPYGSGYQIVAGERRWRACRMLGLSEISVIIKEFTDSQTAQIALIENIQREDLNPVDEAMAYRELMDVYAMTQEQVAETIGKSRSAVANAVRLLALPDYVLDMLKKGQISSGHAKVIAGLKSADMIKTMADKAKNDGITVRKLESLIADINKELTAENKPATPIMPVASAPLRPAKVVYEEDDDIDDDLYYDNPESGFPQYHDEHDEHIEEHTDKYTEENQEEHTPANSKEKQARIYLTEMEISLEDTLKRKVKIYSKDGERGTVTIDFFDKDDLSYIADKLTT